jgi:hypothetical protein
MKIIYRPQFLQKKTINVIAFIIVAPLILSFAGICKQEQDNNGVKLFEINFAKELLTPQSTEKNVAVLIGYRTQVITDEKMKEHYKSLAKETRPQLKNSYFSEDFSFMRIYFPVSDAIVAYRNKKYIANEKGVVVFDEPVSLSELKLMGRKRSERIRGTARDTIVGDSIFFPKALESSAIHETGEVLVFQLGTAPGKQ